jgi:uncharacterized membrane protein
MPQPRSTPAAHPVVEVVGENIRAMLDARRRFEAQKSIHDRVTDRIMAVMGSLALVYVHAALFLGWIALNSGLVSFVKPWDPFPFVLLAVISSMEAILLSSVVLISQNRMQTLADRRADLDLQVNLLAEREVTRVLQTVDAIARRVGAEVPLAKDLHALKQDVSPKEVLEEIERAERALERRESGRS